MIEKVVQIKSEGKKSLGFGKNDLNIMSYLRFLDIETCGGVSLRRSNGCGWLHFRAFARTRLVTTFSLPPMPIGYPF